jgi:hypothetical protein
MNEYLPTTAELIKYADDLLTYCIFNDDNTQQTVDGIQEWAKQNKMRLNIDKTKLMIINQTIKKSLRSDYKTNSTKALTTESTTMSNTKCTICNHQLNTAVGLKIHVTKMHKNINKTKN